MNEIINILADRLEKQAGDIALLNADLAKLQKGSDKYYNWWTEEQGVTTKLEARVKDLESLLAGVPAQHKPNEVSG